MKSIFLIFLILPVYAFSDSSNIIIHHIGDLVVELDEANVYLRKMRADSKPTGLCKYGRLSIVISKDMPDDFEISEKNLLPIVNKIRGNISGRLRDESRDENRDKRRVDLHDASCKISPLLASVFFENVIFDRYQSWAEITQDDLFSSGRDTQSSAATIKFMLENKKVYSEKRFVGPVHVDIRQDVGGGVRSDIFKNAPLSLSGLRSAVATYRKQKIAISEARANLIGGDPLSSYISATRERPQYEALSAMFYEDAIGGWPERSLEWAVWSYVFLLRDMCVDKVPNGMRSSTSRQYEDKDKTELIRTNIVNIPNDLFPYAKYSVEKLNQPIVALQRLHTNTRYYYALYNIFSKTNCSDSIVSTYHNKLVKAIRKYFPKLYNS